MQSVKFFGWLLECKVTAAVFSMMAFCIVAKVLLYHSSSICFLDYYYIGSC